MQVKPPVPKFFEPNCLSSCKIPRTLNEEVNHLLEKLNLNQEVENKTIEIMSQLKLPHTQIHAKAIVYLAMKTLKYPVPQMDKKVEYLVKCIELIHNNLITTLCFKLLMNKRATQSCQTMLSLIKHLVDKLPKIMQNAIAVKIAADLIYYKQGGVPTRIIAKQANIREEQLQCCLNRIKPFIPEIVQDFLNNFKSLSS